MSMSAKNHAANRNAFKAYAASKPADATPSRTWTNATTSGQYQGSGMASSRSNANDHMQHASLGLGAQIRRAV